MRPFLFSYGYYVKSLLYHFALTQDHDQKIYEICFAVNLF